MNNIIMLVEATFAINPPPACSRSKKNRTGKKKNYFSNNVTLHSEKSEYKKVSTKLSRTWNGKL